MPARLSRPLPIALAVVLATAGCGRDRDQPAPADRPVSVLVTQDYGDSELARGSGRAPRRPTTALGIARRFLRVTTRGSRIQSIQDVHAAGRARWQLYVNGLAAAPATPIRPGARLWWDLHVDPARGNSVAVRASVGAFAEPLRSGGAGPRRLPVVLVCVRQAAAACDEVSRRLRSAGVSASRSWLGATSGPTTLRVLVGAWPQVRRDPAAALLGRAPSASGVFARFARRGGALIALDVHGRLARRLPPGSGLVAAMAPRGKPPTWLVTGPDAAGVLAAARTLNATPLANRFAVAVDRGRPLALPAPPAEGASVLP